LGYGNIKIDAVPGVNYSVFTYDFGRSSDYNNDYTITVYAEKAPVTFTKNSSKRMLKEENLKFME